MKNIFTKTSLALSLLLSFPAVAASVTGTTQLPNADNLATEASTVMPCIFGAEAPLVYAQFNYFATPTIAVNPENSKNMCVAQNRDSFGDTGPVYFEVGGDVIANFTKDGGKTWGLSFPQQSSCIINGGTLAQQTGLLTFPLSFSQNGTLYLAGLASQTQPALTAPAFIFVQSSKDSGASWSEPVVIQQTINGIFNSINFPCVGNAEPNCSNNCFAASTLGGILADPVHDCNVHVMWTQITQSELSGIFTSPTLFANIWYARSTDGGKSFSPAKMVYDTSFDPVFEKKHGSPFFKLPCFTAECIGGPIVSVPSKKHKNKQTLLIGFEREYPRLTNLTTGALVQSTDWDDTPNTTFFDHGVIRSCDDGKTWTNIASEMPQFTLATSHDPRLALGTFSLIIIDGALNTAMAVSPKTNRVYAIYQGGNDAISTDPNINQFFPEIEMSASCNKGKTWTQNKVIVSRTQYIPGISNENNQSFNANLAFLPNGLLGIIYTDFRNNTAAVGSNSPVATDVWLALYRETESKTGGSTGIGLDYTGIEVRLTATSFDASVVLVPVATSLPGQGSPATGTTGSINGIAAKGCSFVTAFGATANNQNPAAIVTTPVGTLDFNNRENIIFEQVTP